jgi:tetratricopeptide (TPR) repeat protein
MQWFIFILLTSIYLFTPIQNGLYFNHDLYPITILVMVVSLAFVIRQYWNNELYRVRKGLIVLLLPLCYLITLPFAESPKGAWDSLLSWVLYSTFFILLLWVSTKPQIKDLLPKLFQISGAFMAISMIFSFYGWTYLHNAVLNGRFGGFLQYANTFGMVMVVFFFFSLLMVTDKELTRKQFFLHSFFLTAYMVCFIQSFSRGMLLVFPVVWLLGLMMLPFIKQLKYICNSIISVGSSLIIYQMMVNGEAEKSLYPGLLSLIILTIFTVVCIYFINRTSFELSFTRKKRLRLFLPLLIVLVGILGLLDLRSEGILFNTIPEKLQERISGISVSTGTAQERITFYKDALAMSKESPIIGFGGEGWAAVYKNYQSGPYVSNKIHNGFLEWLIDLGWIGSIIFLSVFVYLMFVLLRSYWKEKDSSLKISVIITILIIFMHSAIDFNFSYGTVWFIVFWLFAIGVTTLDGEVHPPVTTKSWSGIYPKILLSVSALLLIVSLIQSYNYLSANKMFEQTKTAQSFSQKELLLEKAVAKDGSNIKFLTELSKIYMSKVKAKNDPIVRNKLRLVLKDMAEAEPHNSTVLYHLARVYDNLGQNKEALKYFDTALDVDRFNSQLYQDSITFKVKQAMKHKENNEISEMDGVLKSAFEDFSQEKEWFGKTDQTEEGKVFNSRNFHITPMTEFYVSLGYFIKEDYTAVKETIEEIEPTANTENALLAIKILSLDKLYEKYESDQLLRNALEMDKNFIKVIEKYQKMM